MDDLEFRQALKGAGIDPDIMLRDMAIEEAIASAALAMGEGTEEE